MINYWVEKINCFDVLYFLLRSCFSDIEVRFDEKQVSLLAKLLLRLLGKIHLCNNFYAVKLSFDKKNEKGYTIEYAFSRNLETCCQEFCARYFSEESDSFKKAAMSHFALYLYSRIDFITMVETETTFKNKSVAENIFYLVKHPLNSIIISFYNRKNYRLRQSLFSCQWLMYYLRPFCHFAMLLFSRFAFWLNSTNIAEPKPSIWVEYYKNDIVDFIFWRNSLNKNNFDIVYYMDRPDSPPTAVVIKQIEGRGLKWIDMKFFSLARWANLKLPDVLNLTKIIFSGALLIKKIFKLEYAIRFLLYKSVFKRFKVKILIQHQECSWIQVPQSEALDCSNAIMLGFHWSQFFHYRYPMHLFPQHVYFIWGKVMQEWLRKKGNIIRHILTSGVWVSSDEKKQNNLEFPSGIFKFVIAIFDSSIAYNANQTGESLSRFYLHILSLIENNPFWAGIIKSKGRSLSDFLHLPEGEKILDKINALIKDKRLIVLDSLLTPDTAFKHAHLSVCYSLNSAGIIAGIKGYKAIHWDCSGWLHHPIYCDPEQKILYTDINALEEAIIKASNGDKSIGDFSKWQKKFDYFNDDLAAKRVADFIESFMDRAKTQDSRKALDLVVQEYIAKNKITADFYRDENIWGES